MMAESFDYKWRLRMLLAGRGIWNHHELIPLLAERGVHLSNTQVWRLVTGKPERLNLHTLVVLCDLLDCTPNDLIHPMRGSDRRARPKKKAVGERGVGDMVPKRARIRRPRAATESERVPVGIPAAARALLGLWSRATVLLRHQRAASCARAAGSGTGSHRLPSARAAAGAVPPITLAPMRHSAGRASG